MKIYKTRDVKTPTRGTEKSAGIDFYIPNDHPPKRLFPQESVLIPSGIKVEVPGNYALIAMNKSGVSVKKGLMVGACVVDEDYQGEVHIHLINTGSDVQMLQPGDKIVQFLLIPVFYDTIEEVDEIHQESSERGEGGFGSTGNN